MTRALVVAVDTEKTESGFEPQLNEFIALAHAAGAQVVGCVVQRLPRVDPATLVGSGKAREVAETAASLDADALFVFNDLRPRQRINLEKIVPLRIIDRTMLILDVFAQHARSREGKLQVELAQLRHRQANLIGAGTALSRLGGGIGTRGPGETKLETDRRQIGRRISTLRRALEEVRRQRANRRAHGREPLVALVGYTNAGKSSLLNRLASGRDAFVADQPFATLDPLVRRAWIGDGQSIRLADTVGFITELPDELISAFRATLEELEGATLLLHVIDGANPDWERQKKSVDATLLELGLSEKPVLEVYNKADRGSRGIPGDALAVSALTGDGIDALRRAIAARIARAAAV
jgi:GTP-binding protein HflX